MAQPALQSVENRSAPTATGDAPLEVAVPDLRVVARPEYLGRFETLDSIRAPSAARVLAGLVVLSLLVKEDGSRTLLMEHIKLARALRIRPPPPPL